MRNLGVLVLFVVSLVTLAGVLEVSADRLPRAESEISTDQGERARRDKRKPDGGTREEDEEELALLRPPLNHSR